MYSVIHVCGNYLSRVQIQWIAVPLVKSNQIRPKAGLISVELCFVILVGLGKSSLLLNACSFTSVIGRCASLA